MAGRGRKKSDRRVDAAIGVLGGGGGLGPGFPSHVIRRTINKLLKVYGGDDGWPFIQDNSYQLVIDTMLADQEEAKDKSENGDDAGAVETGGQVTEDGEPNDAGAVEAGGQVTEDGEPNDAGTVEAGGQVIEDGEPRSILSSYNPVIAYGEPVPQDLVPADGDPSLDVLVGANAPVADVNWRDISCNYPDPGQPINESPNCPMESTDHPKDSVVPPRASPVSVGENVVPPRPRRKPCYGWISETESEGEEEDALSSSRKQKSDWNVRPFGLQDF